MDSESNDLVFYLIFLLILFFISVCYFLVHSGLFAPVEIRAQRPSFGSLRVAYKFARGPYKNAGHLFTEAHSLIPELKTIGIYYDDPQQVFHIHNWTGRKKLRQQLMFLAQCLNFVFNFHYVHKLG